MESITVPIPYGMLTYVPAMLIVFAIIRLINNYRGQG